MNVINFPKNEETEVPCAACGSQNFMGSTIKLRLEKDSEPILVMICSRCHLKELTSITEAALSVVNELEGEEQKR